MTKEFDARNENKSRSVCAAMAEAADTGKRVLSERERAILDMWPRFEDGEPVWFGDGAAVNVGNIAIEAIEFTDGCAYVKDGACGDYNTLVQVFKHVKRPAPKVLDADGVEIKVGDTVYELETGEEYKVERVFSGAPDPDFPDHAIRCNKVADPIMHVFKPDQLTHRHIVLNADGVEIKVGDRIYSIETGHSYTVRSINGSGTIEFKDFNDKGWSPKYFTHMQPAIDADGVRIREGDTVWIIPALTDTPDEPHEVIGINRWGEVLLEFHTEGSTGLKGEYLTHARPDSWERLEEDAVKVVCEYAGAVPDEFGDYDCDTCRLFNARGNLICEQLMTREIVRRAKALAGVEVAE